MLRKNLSALIIAIFLNVNLCPAYAQVVLTDEELDQISAGGYSVPVEPAKSEDPLVLDAQVSGNGVAFKSSGGSAAQTEALKALALGSNSINSIDVGETSQQNLSSLVNINAAGSIVPVQVNLTVIMNSTVGNVESNNNLNLNSYSTF